MKKALLTLILFTLTFIPLSGNTIKNNATLDSLLSEIQKEYQSNPNRAMSLCQESFKYHDTDKNRRANLYYYYANIQNMQGDLDGCISSLYDAIELLDENVPSILSGKIYNVIGHCYCTLEDYPRALSLNEKATQIFKSFNDSVHLASAYNSRGIIHAYLHEYNKADQYLKLALDINRKQKNLRGIATNLNNLCIYKGNTQEKLEYINEAIIINKNLQIPWSLAENLNNMGKQYFYAGEYTKALETLKEAYDIAKSVNAKGLICDNYEYSAMVYHALKNYKLAYQKQDSLRILSQEIQSVNKLWAIEKAIGQKKLLNEQYKSEQQQERYERLLWKSYISITIIVCGLLLIIGFLMHQRYKRKKTWQLLNTQYQLKQSEHENTKLQMKKQELELEKIQIDLKHTQKEITDLAIFMQSRNELLDKIQDLIKEGYKLNNNDLLVHLKRINAFIKQSQTDKNDSELLQVLNEKSKEFIDRLLGRHPDLTPGERHLAVFLRVNIPTKDIAMLTGTTPKTVNMNRYRLRKSLGLEAETDLVTYLQSI